MKRTANLNAPPTFPAPSSRGVYRVVAALGIVALQAIDSHGLELVQLRMAESAFDQEYVEWMWDLLNEHDPIDGAAAYVAERAAARHHLTLER